MADRVSKARKALKESEANDAEADKADARGDHDRARELRDVAKRQLKLAEDFLHGRKK